MEMKKTTYTAFDNRYFNALPLSRGWRDLRLRKLNTFSTISSIYHNPPHPTPPKHEYFTSLASLECSRAVTIDMGH